MYPKLIVALSLLFAVPTFAQDAAKGEKMIKRCKACHAITAPDGTAILQGGVLGPNLYGLVGKPVASVADFKYGESIVAAREAGVKWDEEALAAYVTDPAAWLIEVTDNPDAVSPMTYKLKKGGADIAAYLATLK